MPEPTKENPQGRYLREALLHMPERPMYGPEGRWKELREVAEAASARVERLERELAQWKSNHDGQVATKRRLSKKYSEQNAQLRVAEALNARYREALETIKNECGERWVRQVAEEALAPDAGEEDG